MWKFSPKITNPQLIKLNGNTQSPLNPIKPNPQFFWFTIIAPPVRATLLLSLNTWWDSINQHIGPFTCKPFLELHTRKFTYYIKENIWETERNGSNQNTCQIMNAQNESETVKDSSRWQIPDHGLNWNWASKGSINIKISPHC